MLDHSRLLEDSWLRWAAETKEDARLCIMGIPFDNAVSNHKGAAAAPSALRELSIELSDLTEDFIPVKENLLYDMGDIPVDLNWERYFKCIEDEALALMKTGKFCLFLGGDHSVTIPLHKAFGKYNRGKKIGVVHFDAHFDLCEEYDGHKWSHACTEARTLEDVISGKDLFFIGVRVAELQEMDVIEKNPGIHIVKAADVEECGVSAIIGRLQSAFAGYDAIYVTLDIDVLDPAFAPGTGTPVSGGLTSRQLIELMKQILESLPVCAMDIVEVAPALDTNDITAWAALRIIHEVFCYLSK